MVSKITTQYCLLLAAWTYCSLSVTFALLCFAQWFLRRFVFAKMRSREEDKKKPTRMPFIGTFGSVGGLCVVCCCVVLFLSVSHSTLLDSHQFKYHNSDTSDLVQIVALFWYNTHFWGACYFLLWRKRETLSIFSCSSDSNRDVLHTLLMLVVRIIVAISSATLLKKRKLEKKILSGFHVHHFAAIVSVQQVQHNRSCNTVEILFL